MRSHRKLIFLMFVLPLLLWFGSAFAEETQQLKRGVLVLPLQAGAGLKDEQVGLGFAVQNVLENVLSLHSDLEDVWFSGFIATLFPQEQDLQAWVRGKGQIPASVAETGMRYLLTGQVTVQNKDIYVKLDLSDRQSGSMHTKDFLLDFPGLIQFRQDFLDLLTQADIPVPKSQRPKMLWSEELSPQAFALMSQGLWERFKTATYQKDHPVYDAKLFEDALTLSPRSYLLLNNRGVLSSFDQKTSEATRFFEQALVINPAGAAAARNMLFLANMVGKADLEETWTKKKAEIQGKDPKVALADLWSWRGSMAYEKGDYPTVLAQYKHALAIYHEVKNRKSEGQVLGNLGLVYSSMRNPEKASGYYEKAVAIFREVKDRKSEGQALQDLGNAYQSLSQYDKAVASHSQALIIHREVKNRKSEGQVLYNLGYAYQSLSQYDKAVASYSQALAIFREAKDRKSEGQVLQNLGSVYPSLSQYDKAIASYSQVLAIFREVKDRKSEGRTLYDLGRTYNLMSQIEKASGYYEQAVAISREVKDKETEGKALHNLGIIEFDMSQYAEAIDYNEQALTIAREIKDRDLEGQTLQGIGTALYSLKRLAPAISYYEQALIIYRGTKQLIGEAGILSNLGVAYRDLKDHEKAINYFEQALTVLRELTDRKGEGWVLNNMGTTYSVSGQHQKGISYFEQSLTIAREANDRVGEGNALGNVGWVYNRMRLHERAIDYLSQALMSIRETKNRDNEGTMLYELMTAWNAQQKSRLAIFYGKQAINAYQEIRGHIQKLEKESQQSFLKSKEDAYRQLADLLIAEGRLPEAQQVLGMLKEEEYFDFIRRDAQDADNLIARSELTPQEADADRRYREIADRLTALGTERGTLETKTKRSAEEEKRLTQLETDLTVAGQAFEKFLNGLETEFTNVALANARVKQLGETQGMMEDLRELGSGTVAIYTLVNENKYHAILITPELQLAREFVIPAAELNRKVLAFREALQNPNTNPQPLAQELYQILIAPLENDLKGAKAETLLWSLDGILRYLPIAALHDGRKYFAEHYRNVIITPASERRLKDTPSKTWKALGFGVTQAHEGFKALPSVSDELSGIIHDKGASKTGGVLPGIVKLDQSFTQDTMLAALRGRDHPVVHIASHFRFQPGDETASFLLLGDGSHLPLSQFKTLPNVFRGVDLLALSACNTATGDAGANGKEVEGFGVLAQRQGAKAVIATLWPVADASTKELMQSFYRIREKGASKAEALQEAQLSLLRGETQISAKSKVGRNSKADSSPEKPKSKAKTFYSHPYFWAPFILIGNSL